MQDPVQDCGSDDMVAENFSPLTVRLVRGKDRRRLLISPRNQIEEAMGSFTIERQISHLVYNQEMELREYSNTLLEFVLILGFNQPFHQV